VIGATKRRSIGVILALAAIASRASANVVFESYEVRKPEAAEFPALALREEFAKLGYVATVPDVKRKLGNQLALPAVSPPAVAPDLGTRRSRAKPAEARSPAMALLKELTDVHQRWLAAKEAFDVLEAALAKAVDDALGSPALVVTDQAIRGKLQEVLLDLILVKDKLVRELTRERGHDQDHTGDARNLQRAQELQKARDDWMAEWIRTFGDEITQNNYGPDAERIYTRVRSERDKLGRGILAITIDNPDVQLYVNETIRSPNRSIPDSPPGRYRVLLMAPNDDARMVLVDVIPNQTTRLAIEWDVTSNLFVSESSIGFVITSATHPEPAVLARKLAIVSGEGDGVVLIGMGAAGQRVTSTASLYSVRSGQLVRGGYIVSDGPQDDTSRRLRALAQFIARGTRDPDVVVTADLMPIIAERHADPVITVPQVPPQAVPGLAFVKWWSASQRVSL